MWSIYIEKALFIKYSNEVGYFYPLQLPHVFVNCVEFFTSRLLLEEILFQLQNYSSATKQASHVPCDTFNDFVRLFKQALASQSLQDQTVYVVSNLILVGRFCK